MRGSRRVPSSLVDVHELQIRSIPPGPQGQSTHSPKPVNPDSQRHAAPEVHKTLRMTVADDGHADVNSLDVWTEAGTAWRSMRSKPNLGKNRSAVVVSR